MLTFRISGKNVDQYNNSNAYMNSTIVEYIEGIEVIKAFGHSDRKAFMRTLYLEEKRPSVGNWRRKLFLKRNVRWIAYF